MKGTPVQYTAVGRLHKSDRSRSRCQILYYLWYLVLVFLYLVVCRYDMWCNCQQYPKDPTLQDKHTRKSCVMSVPPVKHFIKILDHQRS